MLPRLLDVVVDLDDQLSSREEGGTNNSARTTRCMIKVVDRYNSKKLSTWRQISFPLKTRRYARIEVASMAERWDPVMARLALRKRIRIVLAVATMGVSLVAVPEPAVALMPHSPISIDGNDNFTASNGVTAGTGTPSDPYIIEGWIIDATSSNGIWIRNTDAHVVIRKLTIEARFPHWWNIAFSFASNVRVENVTMAGGKVGVYIWYSSRIAVVDSSITGQIGVELYSSSLVSVLRNHIAKEKGIVFWGANGALLEENDISYTGRAIFLHESRNVTLARNILTWNSNDGLRTTRSTNLTIEWNDISHNNLNGVVLESTNDSVVQGNRIAHNGHGVPGRGFGLALVTAFRLRVDHNDFVSNEIQALDTQLGDNVWDGGYPNGGNYWSDYIGIDQCSGPDQDVCIEPDGFGDTPQVVNEAARDRYPLMSTVYDSIPPTIIHVPPERVQVGESFRLTATVEDESEVVYVALWLSLGLEDWTAISMSPSSEGSFFVEVPPQHVPGPFRYYILAWDRWENQARSPAVGEHILQVVETPPPSSDTTPLSTDTVLVVGTVAGGVGASIACIFLLRRRRAH